MSAPASILVVDDKPSICDALRSLLSLEGYLVTAANDVPSAIQELDSGHFAAILTDLNMPGRPGIALVDEVESRSLDIPVILMSGALGNLSSGDARVDRLAGLLAKPFRVATVLSLLRAVIGDQR